MRRQVEDAEGARWVFRCFFTRTARSDAWWAAFLDGDVPQSGMADPAPVEEPEARGHDALARLGRHQPELALSALECKALADVAGEWFRRGATETQIVRAVGTLLPDVVEYPFGFVRKRLLKKMPPEPPAPAQGRYIMECTDCHAPGPPESLPGGLCRICRSEPYVPDDDRLSADIVPGKAERLREAVRTYRHAAFDGTNE
ncbi:hypothetical protein [Streptomyces sp. H27-C3]|uniref:hypothetical protein n=1 Tax=Streptomyces sp. H27-C3 TaxID=3046305 RepID=UPI0024B9CAC7|nr:hypothetical protein [Streptomyces sp. H27-C3]MDJ0464390.1 hypothetical protein [Streptomyces sp. H27-C3]